MLPESRRSDEVAAHIKELIRSEKIKPSEKIPSELELCKSFSVSRPTIREAIKTLVSMGILEIKRGKGTFVSPVPGKSDDPLGLDFLTGHDLRLSLIEARMVLEPEVARLATKKASSADLERIKDSIEAMRAVVEKKQVDMSIELDFHRSIAMATQNQVILRIVPVIMESIIKTYRDTPRSSDDHSHALEEHTHIFEAMLSRNPDKAYHAMYEHLSASYSRSLLKHNSPAKVAK